MPVWVIPVFIALLALSFAMTPPTFLVNRAIDRRRSRRAIRAGAKIYWDGELLAADSAERVRQAWNAAYVVTAEVSTPSELIGRWGHPVELRVLLGSRERVWQFVAEDTFVLASELNRRSPRWERLQAPELSRLWAISVNRQIADRNDELVSAHPRVRSGRL
ncbi:MAG: hypothetical protein OWT27_01150 [Firmicutes bacterium]|nr:hypothetical protein [Bacillota bacterium]